MCLQTMSIIAVITGPIAAVIITLFYQRYKEKRDIKYKAFLLLMAHRKSIPPNAAMVEILNTLDVVFADNQKVVSLWHKYYALLAQPPSEERNHTWLELLTAIAKDLRYPTLEQVDLDKFYVPQGFVDQFSTQQKLQTELLRVLQNSESFGTMKKEDDKT